MFHRQKKQVAAVRSTKKRQIIHESSPKKKLLTWPCKVNKIEKVSCRAKGTKKKNEGQKENV
jgi:hypothetical protein